MATPKAELYSVIEVLLDYANVEVDCLELGMDMFPENAERAKRGREAIEKGKELLAKRSAYYKQKPRENCQ